MVNSTNTRVAQSTKSWDRLARIASVHYPPLLWRGTPAVVIDTLREIRARILTSYAMRHLPRDKDFAQLPEDALASAELSIIVPIHDSPEVTKRCLMSLQKYAPKAEIILVDDGSKLKETQKLLEDFCVRNSWHLIRNPEPLRHSAACNAGSALATRPYLCLLNSDTVVTPWCWRPIVLAFEQNPNVGVAGPSTSYSANAQTLPLAFSVRHGLNDSQIGEYAQHLITERSSTMLTDLPWICGFALFIRNKLWQGLGGFDTKILDYLNEGELCQRVLGAGYRVVWVRNSYIHHLGAVSYKKTIGEKSVETHINDARGYIRQKHGHCDF